MSKDLAADGSRTPRQLGELHADFYAAMLSELAAILGCRLENIPSVFRLARPKVLKLGLDMAILAAYPEVDAARGWAHGWGTGAARSSIWT